LKDCDSVDNKPTPKKLQQKTLFSTVSKHTSTPKSKVGVFVPPKFVNSDALKAQGSRTHAESEGHFDDLDNADLEEFMNDSDDQDWVNEPACKKKKIWKIVSLFKSF